MLCFKKPVRVLRVSGCRVRALRSTEANQTGKKGGYAHRQIVLASQPETHGTICCGLPEGKRYYIIAHGNALVQRLLVLRSTVEVAPMITLIG
jgi:hypothetical protein